MYGESWGTEQKDAAGEIGTAAMNCDTVTTIEEVSKHKEVVIPTEDSYIHSHGVSKQFPKCL